MSIVTESRRYTETRAALLRRRSNRLYVRTHDAIRARAQTCACAYASYIIYIYICMYTPPPLSRRRRTTTCLCHRRRINYTTMYVYISVCVYIYILYTSGIWRVYIIYINIYIPCDVRVYSNTQRICTKVIRRSCVQTPRATLLPTISS